MTAADGGAARRCRHSGSRRSSLGAAAYRGTHRTIRRPIKRRAAGGGGGVVQHPAMPTAPAGRRRSLFPLTPVRPRFAPGATLAQLGRPGALRAPDGRGGDGPRVTRHVPLAYSRPGCASDTPVISGGGGGWRGGDRHQIKARWLTMKRHRWSWLSRFLVSFSYSLFYGAIYFHWFIVSFSCTFQFY